MTKLIARLALVVVLAGVAAFGAGRALANGGRPLDTALSGAAEVSGGDPDGYGSAHLTLNQGQGEICIDADVFNTSTIVMAHIHRGAAGANGPVVVNFTPFISGSTIKGCATGVSADLIKAIRQDPAGYYVNVHSTEHPGGAVRGQLGT